MKKLTLTLAMASALCFGATGFAQSSAANTNDSNGNQKLEAAIEALQTQIDDLKQQVKVSQVQKAVPAKESEVTGDDQVTYENHDNVGRQITEHHGDNINHLPVVTVAPYIGIPSQYDGSELIVNNPSINDDLKLLQMRQQQRAYFKETHEDGSIPRLIFSGFIEGQGVYDTPYAGTSTSDVNLSAAELDSFIEASHWLSGYMSMSYDSSAGSQANRVNNSSLDLAQGFITVGDLDKTDFYSSVGQLYVPFGQYNNFMVSDPMTKTLGRTKTRALVVGYSHESEISVSPFASAYAFQGATEVNDDNTNNQVRDYGLNAGVNYASQQWSGKLGASYISSIADSDGIQGNGDSSDYFNGFGQDSSYENLNKNVPGFDAYGSLGYNNYTVLAEYTTATTHFDQGDLSYNNAGAKPAALDLQAAYAFTYWRPSYIAFDYGKSWQALAIGLPEDDFGFTYGVSVWRHALVSFQVLHNNGYSSDTQASGWGGTAVDPDQLGSSYNSATLQLDMYF